MHTYMILFSFTPQGMKHIKDSPARVDDAKRAAREMGANVKAFYALLGSGSYDTMFLLEAPDDETVAKIVLAISSLGNVRTETHRLFSQDEYRKVIAALP